jgi:hypothetical protein
VHEVKFGDSAHAGKDSEWGSHAIELWARVRDWLPGGMIEKDDGEKGSLSQQAPIRGWRWSLREEGKKILETKEDLQKRGVQSPDDFDALAAPSKSTRRGARSPVRRLRSRLVAVARRCADRKRPTPRQDASRARQGIDRCGGRCESWRALEQHRRRDAHCERSAVGARPAVGEEARCGARAR